MITLEFYKNYKEIIRSRVFRLGNLGKSKSAWKVMKFEKLDSAQWISKAPISSLGHPKAPSAACEYPRLSPAACGISQSPTSCLWFLKAPISSLWHLKALPALSFHIQSLFWLEADLSGGASCVSVKGLYDFMGICGIGHSLLHSEGLCLNFGS